MWKVHLFLWELFPDAEEDKLREHFAECGTVDNVRLIRDKKTGIGKGIGYVSFQVHTPYLKNWSPLDYNPLTPHDASKFHFV